MTEPLFSYDEPSDSLHITFGPGEPATAIELNEHILLRIDIAEQRLVGITLFDFSILAQPTELGPRSFPLTGLKELSADTRELVLKILRQRPAREVLALSAYSPGPGETIPITSLQPGTITPRAA